MLLFVAMPFIGGWIGYTYAPTKVVEVEKVIIKEIPAQEELSKVDMVQGSEEIPAQEESIKTDVVQDREEVIPQEIVGNSEVANQYKKYSNAELDIEFEYPSHWLLSEYENDDNSPSYTGERIFVSSPDSVSQIELSVYETSRFGPDYDSVSEILQGKNSGKGWIGRQLAMKVSGIDAVSYFTGAEGSEYKMVKFEHNGLVYLFSMWSDESDSQNISNLNMLDNLVKTVKILN